MDLAWLAPLGVKLGVKGAEIALDAARTKVDITINIAIKNQHQGIRLEYATRFILGGGCLDAPASEIDPKVSSAIQLKADGSSNQFEGVLLYKLMPSKLVAAMSNSIYVALCWRVSAFSGLRVYMTLIEHDGDSVSLGSDTVKKYYYQLFRDKPRKLNETIRCSWLLDDGTLFTISMTAGDNRTGKINVEIKENRSKANESEPIPIELEE
jgi:hypothetical protein